MKKLLKIFAIFIISLLALVAVAFVAVSILLPPEKVKEIIVSQASKQLKTDISLDRASFNLFTGIELNKLVINDPKSFKSSFPNEPLLSVNNAKIDVNILSLLMGKLAVSGVTLDKPSIKLETNAKGETNIDALLPKGETKADKEKQNGAIPDFSIGKIEVKNAYLHNIDNQLGNENKINKINAKVTNLGKKKDSTLTAKLYTNELPVAVETRFMLDLDKKQIALNNLVINIPKSNITGSGNIDFADKPDITLTLFTDKLDIDALNTASGSSTSKAEKEKFKVDVPKDISAHIKFTAKQIVSKDNTIDNLNTDVKLADQQVSVEATAMIKGSPASANVHGDFRDRFYPKLELTGSLSELKITIKDKDPNSPEPKISNSDIDKMTTDIPENLSVKANLKVTKLDIGNLIAQNNVINLAMDKKVINLNVSDDIYGGKFNMSGIFDTNVSGLGYNITSLSANNVDGAGLLRDFSTTFLPKSFRGLVGDLLDSGKAYLNLTAKGAGIGSESLMQNLTSNVAFVSDNAVLKENKMLTAVAPLVQNNKLSGKIKLNQLNAKISTAKGIAKVNTAIDSRDANLKATFIGDIDLVNKSYKDNKLSVWVNNNPVEFRLTGAIDKPIPQPLIIEQKTKELQNQVQQEINKKGQDLLKGLFK